MRVIIWAPGYVESASLGYVISSTFFVGNGTAFDSNKEAIETLAMDLWKHYCHQVKENSIFHKKYGKGPAPSECNRDDFADFVCQMPGSVTNDGTFDEWVGEDYKLSFSPHWADYAIPDISIGKFIFIQSNADAIFCAALSKFFPKIFTDIPDYTMNNYNKLCS